MDEEVVTALYENCVTKLEGLGYYSIEQDRTLLTYMLETNIQYVFNNCNITELPEGLYYQVVNKTCGDFLLTMQNTNKLPSGFEFEAGIKRLKEGDVTIEYNSAYDLISTLNSTFNQNLTRYRKIAW